MAPASEGEIERWNRQFKELGADKVRGELIIGHWNKDKRSAARLWLERTDAASWQKARPVGTSSRGTFFLNLRNAKWWGYVTAGLFLAWGIFRVLRRL